MYNLTRQEAAERLWVSTRSIDRYIKSGKIRSKKDSKIVYVNDKDIENMSSSTSPKQEVIVKKDYKEKKKKDKKEKIITREVEVKSNYSNKALDIIYTDLKSDIQKKDEIIKELSIRLGRAEEIAKNSVNLIDYKKSQFLLEESRNYLNNEIDDLKDENSSLQKKLRYEKSSNIILIFLVIVLFAVASVIWFLNI